MEIAGEIFTRVFNVERIAPTSKKGRAQYRASLSSETAVRQRFGLEILDHSPGSVNLERAERGLTLLFNHDLNVPVGKVKDIHLDGRRLVGDLTFGRSKRAQEIQTDVDDGVLDAVSLQYRIDDARTEQNGDGETFVRAIKWTPMEASIVTVAADHSVGIGRSRGNTMTKKTPDSNVRAINSEAESQRLAEIQVWRDLGQSTFRSLAAGTVDRLCDIAVAKGQTGDQVRQAIAAKLSEQEPEQTVSRSGPDRPTPAPWPHVSGGEPAYGELGDAVTDALLMRGGIPVSDPHPGADDLRNRRIVDFAELVLNAYGTSTRGWTPQRMIGEALQMRTLIGHGSSDFTGILANVADKALNVGFIEAASQHRQIVRLGELRDFKSARRVALGDFSDLDTIPEAGEYRHGSYGEQSATIVAAKYGKLFAITREALVNDDVSAFSQVPRGMAAAAARMERDKVFDILTGSTTAPDGNNLFRDSPGDNIGTAGAPSVTTLDEARKQMAVQTGPGGAVLNIQPRYLVVPAALRTTAEVLVAATLNPAEGSTTSFVSPNPFQGALIVISDAVLDSSSATAWFLLADPNMYDTIEIGHVGGAASPTLESRDG
jgi:HK97 family phage prohead protease